MFHTIEAFVQEFEMESGLTEKALDALTDESLAQAVTEQHRTLGRLAWHLVNSYGFMTQMGLKYDEPLPADEAPSSAAEIASEYRRMTRVFLRAVRSQWTDGMLGESVQLFGENWKYGDSLRFVLRHEIHHRGQMTVLMRQAGLRVPGLFGPTREEWIEMGETPRA